MNILIVGGLIVVGLAALVGCVFLARGEGWAQGAEAASTRGEIPQTIPPPLEQRESVPARAADAARPTVPLSRGSIHTAVLEEPQHAEFNGQLRELVVEVRVLHQQAGAIEQHLSRLKALVDSMEQTQQAEE